MVYDRELATDVDVSVEPHELASIFSIEVTAKPGADLDEIEEAIDRISAAFFAKGPNRDELKRAKTKINASAVRGLERIGGFGGKAVTLAQGALYAGDPGFYKNPAELDQCRRYQIGAIRLSRMGGQTLLPAERPALWQARSGQKRCRSLQRPAGGWRSAGPDLSRRARGHAG
ncbi:MAG: hypothetical protein Q9M45_05460 [Robiginitomaculum sp.]|nr:hypothetical protein [Robiginitomaculum sp.]